MLIGHFKVHQYDTITWNWAISLQSGQTPIFQIKETDAMGSPLLQGFETEQKTANIGTLKLRFVQIKDI